MSFSVRVAVPADYPTFARLFPELGVADPLATSEQFASRMLPRVVVLEEERDALGYSFWNIYGKTAHVVHVVVDPRARGRGAGRALMDDVRRRVSGEGCTRWYLNVKQDNVAALCLYQRCGMSIETEGWAVQTTWAALATLPGTTDGVTQHVPSPGDDAALAVRFDLDRERIAVLRARPGVVLLVLREGDVPAAFAAFDPAFPGVYPVRVARANLARPLFDAFRPHARVEHVNVFVEGDRELFARMQNAGAELQHAIYRMGAGLR